MRSARVWVVIAALAIALGDFSTAHSSENPVSSKEQFVYSNETFVRLVKKYSINDGEKIDYDAWKESAEDLQALDQQVRLLAGVSPASDPDQFPTPASKRSYWINTYNTLVLQIITMNKQLY